MTSGMVLRPSQEAALLAATGLVVLSPLCEIGLPSQPCCGCFGNDEEAAMESNVDERALIDNDSDDGEKPSVKGRAVK